MGLKSLVVAPVRALCEHKDVNIAVLRNIESLIIDASAFRHWVQGHSGIQTPSALLYAIINKYLAPLAGGPLPDLKSVFFLFDDNSKHVPERLAFLEKRYPRNEAGAAACQPGTKDTLDTLLTNNYTLKQIIDSPTGSKLLVDYLADNLIRQKYPFKLYVRAGTAADQARFPRCTGLYETIAGNPSVVGHNHGEVDIEAHALARALDTTCAIVSNDQDHFLVALAFNNPKTILIPSWTTKNKIITVTYHNIDELLRKIEQKNMTRETLMYKIILSGTDTCLTKFISPTKSAARLFDKASLDIMKRRRTGLRVPYATCEEICMNTHTAIAYIKNVLMTPTKVSVPYATAKELEYFYLLLPFWTILYFHGFKPSSIPRNDTNTTMQYPLPGLEKPFQFYSQPLELCNPHFYIVPNTIEQLERPSKRAKMSEASDDEVLSETNLLQSSDDDEDLSQTNLLKESSDDDGDQ